MNAEQAGLLYYVNPSYVATPNTSEGLRLYRSSVDNQYYVKYSDGTSELFSVGITGMMQLIGTFDASVNAFPLAGSGSGAGGAIQKGDTWLISVAGTLPVGQEVVAGDVLIALTDAPAQDPANWFVVEKNLGYVPENVANKATDFTTVNDILYPSVKAVEDRISGTAGRVVYYGASGITGDAGFTWDSANQILAVGINGGSARINVNGGNAFNATVSIRQDVTVGYIIDLYNNDFSRAYVRAAQDGTGAGTTGFVSIMSTGGVSAVTAYDVDGTRRVGFGSHASTDAYLLVSREDIYSNGTQGLFFWTDTASSIAMDSGKGAGYATPYIEMISDNGAGTVESFKLNSKGLSYFVGASNLIGFGLNNPTARVHIKGTNNVDGTSALRVDNSDNAILFHVQNGGKISMPLLQTGDAGLSVGDLYMDDPANIIADGNLAIAIKQ